ncbi:MAG: hypothetical protein ABI550_05100 [Ignavibacteriaceae bacterium]
MSKTVKKKNVRQTKKVFLSPFKIYWNRKNYLLLFLGIILLIIGFYVMSLGNWDSTASLVFSPIILVIAYVLIFPASIFYEDKNDAVKSEEDKVAARKS